MTTTFVRGLQSPQRYILHSKAVSDIDLPISSGSSGLGLALKLLWVLGLNPKNESLVSPQPCAPTAGVVSHAKHRLNRVQLKWPYAVQSVPYPETLNSLHPPKNSTIRCSVNL